MNYSQVEIIEMTLVEMLPTASGPRPHTKRWVQIVVNAPVDAVSFAMHAEGFDESRHALRRADSAAQPVYLGNSPHVVIAVREKARGRGFVQQTHKTIPVSSSTDALRVIRAAGVPCFLRDAEIALTRSPWACGRFVDHFLASLPVNP